MTKKLLLIYDKLYQAFGPQSWWPAESPFEVALGAILTQNTSWQNVERAIVNLKKADRLSFEKLSKTPRKMLARLIKPAGYYNIKAGRLKHFLMFLKKSYQGSLKRMREGETSVLRGELLAVKGIGEETADSILLYALQKPVFVVDAYTRRVFSRHGFVSDDVSYGDLRCLFMDHLENDVKLFNEYHALIVRLGKEYCGKGRRKCSGCPLEKIS